MAPPLSAAEMQRRYRAKRDADPERRARYLQKEREKWQHDKATGKKKSIADMSEREKCAQRKKWKERKRQAKARQKARAEIPPDTTCDTTPDTARGTSPPTNTHTSPAEHSRFEFLYKVIVPLSKM